MRRRRNRTLCTPPRYGSHLPVLMKVVAKSSGPILELGGGCYSTPFLHFACFSSKRPLTTCDASEEFVSTFLNAFATDYHRVIFVKDYNWDAIDLSPPWSVAFVDHDPAARRVVDVARLTHAEYVVCHDTERRRNRHYHWETIVHLFKYHFHYYCGQHATSVMSNVHNLRRIMQ